MGGQEHFYMESQSVLAVPKEEDQEIDVCFSAVSQIHTGNMESLWRGCS